MPALDASSVRTTPTDSGLTGPHDKVDLLGRGFLIDGRQERDFGFYLYLIFLPGAAERDRSAAASAFLGENRANDYLRRKQDRGSIALLAVPIRGDDGQSEPETKEQILQRYDGAYGTIIASRVPANRNVPLVAIVAYPTPIEANSDLDPARLLVVDACGDDAHARAKFRALHDRLRRGEFDTSMSLVDRVLQGFGAVGNLIVNGTPSACAQ